MDKECHDSTGLPATRFGIFIILPQGGRDGSKIKGFDRQDDGKS